MSFSQGFSCAFWAREVGGYVGDLRVVSVWFNDFPPE
jgi:hypothetical protein